MDTNSTKTFSWRSAILLFLGVGLLTASLSLFIQTRNLTVHSSLAEGPKPVAAAPAPMGLGSSFEVSGQPVRLIIPKLGVNAFIKSVGLESNGDMQTPGNATDVAWYKDGPRPGMPGNAVINGHLDTKYVPEAVFYDLGKLVAGDIVQVVDDTGKTLQFQVIGSKDYNYNATTTDIFYGDISAARLNLITCAGDWIKSEKVYDKRVVVFTELVSTF